MHLWRTVSVMAIRIGDVLYDRDHRRPGRTVEVIDQIDETFQIRVLTHPRKAGAIGSTRTIKTTTFAH